MNIFEDGKQVSTNKDLNQLRLSTGTSRMQIIGAKKNDGKLCDLWLPSNRESTDPGNLWLPTSSFDVEPS